MAERHFVADDLGYPRDHGARTSFRAIDSPPSEQTWLERADVLLELDAQERLTRERLLDEIDEAKRGR